MTTADRIDPIHRTWTPTVVVAEPRKRVGKHRGAGGRYFSLRRLLYTARHARRGR